MCYSDEVVIWTVTGFSDQQIASILSQLDMDHPLESTARSRTYMINYFGEDDGDLIANATTIRQYWTAVLQRHRPRTMFDLQKVLVHLSHGDHARPRW